MARTLDLKLGWISLAALLLVRVSSAQNGELTLELASVVFRHGDRSPVGTYPTDKFTESDWPQGYGQLSVVGMIQQHLLGEILRARYVPDLLNENYTRVQVYVRSTDVDRCLMSAEAQLSGLFPPGPEQQFNSTILWQPIPVHTVPKEQDILLRAHDTFCPAYTQLREEDKLTEEYQKVEQENQDFFKYLEVHSGVEVVNLTNIWYLQDTLYVENVTEGKGTPDWLSPENLTQLNHLADFTMTLMYNSKPKKRITAGNWLSKVLSDMKGKANCTQNDSKLFLYSAHDTTVAPMMSALDVWNHKQPPYATAFFVELYSDSDKKYYVKLLWRKGPDSESVVELKKMTLDEFESFVTPLIPTDWIEECKIPPAEDIVPKSASHGIVALGVLFSISIIALIVVSVVLGLVCWEKGPRYHKIGDGSTASPA